MNDLFVDRLGNSTIGNGLERLDFLRRKRIDRERPQVTVKIVDQLIPSQPPPPPSILALAEAMEAEIAT